MTDRPRCQDTVPQPGLIPASRCAHPARFRVTFPATKWEPERKMLVCGQHVRTWRSPGRNLAIEDLP